jgi:hypothetical protein
VSPLTLSRGRISTRSRTLVTKEPWKRDSAITHTPEFVRFGVEHREVVQ